MTCPKLSETVANHLDDGLSPVQRAATEAHLANCPECRDAAASLGDMPAYLSQWQDQPVPRWDRKSVTRGQRAAARWQPWWQWTPVMASLALVIAVVFNLQISRDTDGFTIAFGAGSSRSADEAYLVQLVEQFSEQQAQQQMQMMNVVLTEFADSTASSLEDVIVWFESQRQQDLQMLEASFQEMLEREYETVRSMQQLASYVQLTSAVR